MSVGRSRAWLRCSRCRSVRLQRGMRWEWPGHRVRVFPRAGTLAQVVQSRGGLRRGRLKTTRAIISLSLSKSRLREHLANPVGYSRGEYGWRQTSLIVPVLILEVDGTHDDVPVDDDVEASTGSVGKIRAAWMPDIVLLQLNVKVAESNEALAIKLETVVGKNESRPHEKGVLPDVVRRDEGEVVEVCFHAVVKAKVEIRKR